MDTIPQGRRRILQALFGGSLAALGFGAGGVISKYLAPIAGQILSALAGKTSDLTDANPAKVIKLGLKDVMVVRDGDKITAFDLKCSHAGCTVKWQPDEKRFHCPCHGGTYAADGHVVSGPPPRPLSKLRIAVGSNGEMTVTDLPA